MFKKTYPIQIWFLDYDLRQSAQALTNKLLARTIAGCYDGLIAARMYSAGIRSLKFYKHYFDDSHRFETMEKHFPLWPFSFLPPFKAYDSKAAKWCRQCKEHYDCIMQYLSFLLEEHSYRFHKPHHLDKFLEWHQFDAPKINVPNANLKKITFPWKCLNPKYRRKDIVEGYRLQYKHVIGDPFDAYANTSRDIPSWIMDKYQIIV